MRGALAQAAPQAIARQIELSLDAPDILPARLDQPAFESIAHNLINNALRYTPHGGQVTVRVWRSAEASHLGVVDDGPGIPEDELAHAGERFFRGSNTSQPGTGLGLAIVQAIAVRHGASLQLGTGAQQRGLAATLVFPHTPT